MLERKKTDNTAEPLTEQEKVISLFQFISEMNKLKQKTILNIENHPFYLKISEIHEDTDNIQIFYRDTYKEEIISQFNGILLSIHKPEYECCPEPYILFKDWLLPGWDNFRFPAEVKEYIELKEDDTQYFDNLFDYAENNKTRKEKGELEYFSDSEERVQSFEEWKKVRNEWVAAQRILQKTRALFSKLYNLYFELLREAETEEIIVANGFIYDLENRKINHPVLTRRVKLEYNPETNNIYILDTDISTELYSILFQNMDDINISVINKLREELFSHDYHPLDRNETPDYLKVLIHQLSSNSIFSENGVPQRWNRSARFLLCMDPCYIVRNRLDGTIKTIEQIIENINNTGEVPAPISNIVSGGEIEIAEDTGVVSVEEQLAAVGGESVDILLSKEANKEQLEIARRIENYNAVLVQGPPGTGKTHTIANLMGHFIAQGKSVLVTSHTKKALKVLKDKVAPGLQNLCVSILDDSNADMERSIDGITAQMAQHTSYEIKRELDMLSKQRQQVIEQLGDVRRKIFMMINQECTNIVYNGEGISPSKAAEFIVQNEKSLSYIPGKVRLNMPIPLTFDQLKNLYKSNEEITAADEDELSKGLPNPESILSPSDCSSMWNGMLAIKKQIEQLLEEKHWKMDVNSVDMHLLKIVRSYGELIISYSPEIESGIIELKHLVESLNSIKKWQCAVIVDGMKGGIYLKRWQMLVDQMNNTYAYADSLMEEQFGRGIHVTDYASLSNLKSVYSSLREQFIKNGKISKLARFLNKEYNLALSLVTFGGKELSSAEDCDIVLHLIELNEMRNQCAIYWDELFTSQDEIPKFNDFNSSRPEEQAKAYVIAIEKYLKWYEVEYPRIVAKLNELSISSDMLFDKDELDSEQTELEKIICISQNDIPSLCDLCIFMNRLTQYQKQLEQTKKILKSGRRIDSQICQELYDALTDRKIDVYAERFVTLTKVYDKYKLQTERIEMLNILDSVAPEWAEAIRLRSGIHGICSVPHDIEDAWKWKQYYGIIEEITAQPFHVLQEESKRLSKEYRIVTAKYAEKSGWYQLLRRTEADINMKQALQGWKMTMKRIGKGTGKKAPELRAKARELMIYCQKAVPGWIMPMNRALDSLDPKKNRFDIIIIDEASQSDISSLAILYMGKKLIIVGDDKQVSPLAVGIESEKLSAIEEMYIKDKIPNSHLYTAKTSIYDIAATTFQPLMLREHFRCVPDIIGFSNMLSYNYKIKPLREASSSSILPAVVNYRVFDGKRLGTIKSNVNEAKAIVALMRACMEQPEYENKTFGVISLLGDLQVKIIQQMIEQKIEAKNIISRNILCGNSANFQGDERDVIFLSLVDSGNENGTPIRLQSYGSDDAYRKRYNVAASRAKDQLWIVDSLDPANDLKPGDIRKTLIEYSMDPQASKIKHMEIEAHAESPFETAVASALTDRGYHLVQQWEVGAYRLDMVAVCGDKTVAIECDGERWHSGEDKIREDMERQTILERLGWHFIRIRGSEFYRNPEQSINRVVEELAQYDIFPEQVAEATIQENTSELLERVKKRAAILLLEDENKELQKYQ